MTATTHTTEIRPVRGPMFKRATQLTIEDAEHRKLFCLLAAYLDAGQRQPPAADLAARLGIDIQRFDVLLKEMERAKLIRVCRAPPATWWRNSYFLKALGDKQRKLTPGARRHRQKQLVKQMHRLRDEGRIESGDGPRPSP